MSFQPIYFFPDDDTISIKDQIKRSSRDHIGLVVPKRFAHRLNRVDLIMLKRATQQQNKEFAVITSNRKLRDLTKELSIPTFRSEDDARQGKHEWRLGRRMTSVAGVNRLELGEIERNFNKRKSLTKRKLGKPSRSVWLFRYAIILAIFIISALTFVGIVYAIPGATIQLQPESNEIRVSRLVTADPAQTQTLFTEGIIPARVISSTVSWQTEMNTIGTVEAANLPSRGRAVFTNNIDQPIVIPAGTVIRTTQEGGIAFQTVSTVNAPGISGGTVEVGIVALNAGPGGNLSAGELTVVDGSLAIQLSVVNPAATSGGAIEPVQGVSQADIDQLRVEVQNVIKTVAQSRFQPKLQQNEFIIPESIIIASIENETFSHQIGQETDLLSLRTEAIVIGTAINPIPANDIVYSQLVQSIEQNSVLKPDSFRFAPPSILSVDEFGRVEMEMVATGQVTRKIDIEPHLEKVAGQEIGLAMRYLEEQLPLVQEPTARVVPNWLGRLPYLPSRIEPIVE